jgi:hypothetical protein
MSTLEDEFGPDTPDEVVVTNFPEQEKLSGVLNDIKKVQEDTVQAIKQIPETKIPSVIVPDNKDLFEIWKDEVLDALKIEIPKVDLKPVIAAIQKIKIPEVPQSKDYTAILNEIKKNLPKETDLTPILEAIKDIKTFEIPERLIYKDHLKVTPDRVGGGGGVNTVGLATTAKQDEIITAIGNAPAPVGGATSVNQDTLISLIGTLQELNARLMVIAGMANAGAPALRVIPIASVSTAVTGSVTATVASTSITNFGTGIPASEMAHDMNNMTAVLANINNANA